MRSRQSGITFIGWVVLLLPVAIVVFAGIKVSTIYMNHYKVAKVLDQTARNIGTAGTITPATVRNEIERRFDIEGIETPALDDVVIERDGDNWVIVAEYNRETSLFGNLNLLIRFNKRAVVQ
jgi:Flp pilus assembly protein TadG